MRTLDSSLKCNDQMLRPAGRNPAGAIVETGSPGTSEIGKFDRDDLRDAEANQNLREPFDSAFWINIFLLQALVICRQSRESANGTRTESGHPRNCSLRHHQQERVGAHSTSHSLNSLPQNPSQLSFCCYCSTGTIDHCLLLPSIHSSARYN